MEARMTFHHHTDLLPRLENLLKDKVGFKVDYIDTLNFSGWCLVWEDEVTERMARKLEIESIVDSVVKKLDVNK